MATLNNNTDVIIVNPLQEQLLVYRNNAWVNADPGYLSINEGDGRYSLKTHTHSQYALSSDVYSKSEVYPAASVYTKAEVDSLVSGIPSGGGGGTGTVTVGSNLGGGTPVYKNTLNGTMNFRTLVSGSPSRLTITTQGDTVVITAAEQSGGGGEGTVTGVTNLGAGNKVVLETLDGTNIQARTLTAGSGVGITLASNALSISNSHTFSNLGNVSNDGSAVLIESGDSKTFKRIKGANNTTVTGSDNSINISSPSYSAASLGSGADGHIIYNNTSTDTSGNKTFNFKRIEDGKGISFTLGSNNIVVNSSVGGVNLGSSTGTHNIYQDTDSSGNLRFNRLKAGSLVSITKSSSVFTISTNISSTTTTSGLNMFNIVDGVGYIKDMVGGTNINVAYQGSGATAAMVVSTKPNVTFTQVTTTSSIKYKNIFHRESADFCLEDIVKMGRLGVAVGQYKENHHGADHLFFIKEEVERIDPRCVYEDSIRTTDILAKAVSAIAALEARVKELERGSKLQVC